MYVCVCARAREYIHTCRFFKPLPCLLLAAFNLYPHTQTHMHTYREREREREREGERRRERERGEQLGSLQVGDSPYCVDQTNRLYIAKTLNLARRLFKFNVTVL